MVSLIIPVYNVKPYLRQAIESVISQSYRNLEILIIDDGSFDGSSIICDEYAALDSRITVYHKENGGLSSARNYGLDHMSEHSQYVAFLDSDDWMKEDAIESLLNILVKTDADIACCKYTFQYKTNGSRTANIAEQDTHVLTKDDILQSFCSGRNIGNVVWNKLYKKELFSDIRYPEGKAFEDVATTYKILLKASKVACTSSTLINYRVRENSISHSYDLENLQDYWWAHHKQYEDLVAISETYGTLVLGSCMSAIGRMWRWYSGFSKEEKIEGKALLCSMQHFAAEHRKEVMGSSDISKLQKIWCICAKCKHPIFLRLLYIAGRVYRNVLWKKKLFE